MKPAWRGPLLGLVAGAGGMALLMGWLGPRDQPVTMPEGTPPTPAETPTTGREEGSAPECYLGAVVPRRSVKVAAQSEGQLEAVLVEVGDRVAAGAVLARLDTRLAHHELDIERAALAAAQAEVRRQASLVERAKQELERLGRLEKMISDAEIALAASKVVEAEAQLSGARAGAERVEARIARLDTLLERAEIRAPFDGIVASRGLDPGAVVAPGTPVVRLISDGELRVRFAVPPDEATSLRVGTTVSIELPDVDRTLEGRVEQVAPEVDTASRMLFVQAALVDAEPSLASGVAVRVSRAGVQGRCLRRVAPESPSG